MFIFDYQFERSKAQAFPVTGGLRTAITQFRETSASQCICVEEPSEQRGYLRACQDMFSSLKNHHAIQLRSKPTITIQDLLTQYFYDLITPFLDQKLKPQLIQTVSNDPTVKELLPFVVAEQDAEQRAKLSNRDNFAAELANLTKLIIHHNQFIVIDLGNYDDFSPKHFEFFNLLSSACSMNLILLMTTSRHKREFIGIENYFIKNKSIANRWVEKLVDNHFKLGEKTDRKAMISFFVEQHDLRSASQAYELIKTLHQYLSKEVTQKTETSLWDMTSEPDAYCNYYLSRSKFDPNIKLKWPFESTLTEVENRLLMLTTLLGPFFLLETLKKAYEHCFPDEMPNQLDWMKFGLIISKRELIRHRNLTLYQQKLFHFKSDKSYIELSEKISDAISTSKTIRRHIDFLYKKSLSDEEEVRLPCQLAIVKIYSMVNEHDLPDDKSGSENDNDKKQKRTNSLSKYSKFNSTDYLIITKCFTSIITHYSGAVATMALAIRFSQIASHFINCIHPIKFDSAAENLTLSKLYEFLAESSNPQASSTAQGIETIHESILGLLVNIIMTYYFTEQYWLLRKATFHAKKLLGSAPSDYAPIVDACLSLMLVQDAEKMLHEIIDDQMQSKNDKEKVIEYEAIRNKIQDLITNAQTGIKNNPNAHEKALAYSMMGGVSANYFQPFQVSYQFLATACQEALSKQEYLKAALAWGNAILLHFCVGAHFDDIKQNSMNFLATFESNPATQLPCEIIRGFKKMVQCFEDPNYVFDKTPDLKGPNRYFMNFILLVCCFIQQDYEACCRIVEAVMSDFFNPKNENNRLGYSISSDFLLLAALAMLNTLDMVEPNVRVKRISQIARILLIISDSAKYCMANYSHRWAMAINFVNNSKYATEFLFKKSKSTPLAVMKKLQETIEEKDHFFFGYIVAREIDRIVQEEKAVSAATLLKYRPQEPIAKILQVQQAKDRYISTLTNVISKTRANIIMLVSNNHIGQQRQFLYSTSKWIPMILQTKKDNLLWNQACIDRAFAKKSPQHSSMPEAPSKKGRLRPSRVEDMSYIAIPVEKNEVIKYVLYIQSIQSNHFDCFLIESLVEKTMDLCRMIDADRSLTHVSITQELQTKIMDTSSSYSSFSTSTSSSSSRRLTIITAPRASSLITIDEESTEEVQPTDLLYSTQESRRGDASLSPK